MSQPWLRLYTEILDDHRIQTLPDNLFKLLLNSWCIMKRSGKITAEEAAWRLHRQPAHMEGLLKRLEIAGFLERKDGFWIPHNWDGRQFHSDDAYERVKRFRYEKRNVSRNVSRNARETEMKPPQTQTQTTDTDSSSIRKASTDVNTHQSRAREKTPDARENGSALAERHSDRFEEFIGNFLAAGKVLNQRDNERALRLWLNFDPPTHSRILAHVTPCFTDGTWSDARHTPMPARYLESEAWTRAGPGRLMRNPPRTRGEHAQAEAARQFLEESDEEENH